jgi:hypothetical protein
MAEIINLPLEEKNDARRAIRVDSRLLEAGNADIERVLVAWNRVVGDA